MSDFHIIIPARYESTRLPHKLMLDIGGKTVLERSYQQALKANPKSIIIATDSQMIVDHALQWGARVCLTDSHHRSGTERLAQVVSEGGYKSSDVLVNVQGDEPFIDFRLIRQVAESLVESDVSMATLCWPVESLSQLNNPNVVKVVRDRSLNAIYFSRSAIPAHRDDPRSIQSTFAHLGIYAYRAQFLQEMVTWPMCELESLEALEQLRVLWMGHQIRVDTACVRPLQDINTMEDLELARKNYSTWDANKSNAAQ